MRNNINKLHRVMMRANYLYGSNIILLRGANLSRREKQKVSLKLAWYFVHFRDMLASGVYRFSYFKKDGSIREARGTLDPTIIPEDKFPGASTLSVEESGLRQECYNTFCYYDLDAQGWRSFLIDLFIGFVEQV